MCISGFGRGSKSSAPVKKVATDEKKKKSLIKNEGGRDRVSPTSSVNTGNQGLSGRDSFGNREGQRGGMTGRY